jgi:hypothetical protein
MLINKYFKYRIYPNKYCVSKLDYWTTTLRFLWNIAHEQRLLGYSRLKGEKIFLFASQQQKELTLLRKEFDWIRSVPRHAEDKTLIDLETAWQRYFDKVSGMPGWKKRTDNISICETDAKIWSICKNKFKFSKLPAQLSVTGISGLLVFFVRLRFPTPCPEQSHP